MAGGTGDAAVRHDAGGDARADEEAERDEAQLRDHCSASGSYAEATWMGVTT